LRIFFKLLTFFAKKHILHKFYVIFYLLDRRKKVILRNLEIAFPKLGTKEYNDLTKKVYKNYLIFLEDSICNNKKVLFKNEHYLQNLLKQNEKIIFMSAHLGNFEIMPKEVSRKFNINLAVVMREMKNKDINEFFKNIRANEKITLLYKHSAKEVIKFLKKNIPVGILIDQNYNRAKIKVKFFYENTFFNEAISKFARGTNAYVLPVFCYLEENKYVIEFFEPKQYFQNIQEFTQWQASLIEKMIKKYPDQYFWFHKRWKRTHKY